jgi:hypothetical protein
MVTGKLLIDLDFGGLIKSGPTYPDGYVQTLMMAIV